MALDPKGPKESMAPLFDLVVKHVPPARVEEGPFRLLATTLEADPYLGRLLTGRITSGTVKPGQTVKALGRDGREVEQFRVNKVLAFRGLERTAIDQADAVPAQGELALTQEHALIRGGDDYAELFARVAAQNDTSTNISASATNTIARTPTQPTDMEFKA